MSESNGVLKITRRSDKKFQFGDDQPVLTFDVVEVADQWHEINFKLRVLENDLWVVPAAKTNEFAIDRLNFVQALVNDAYKVLDSEPPTITRIEAEEFIALVRREADELRNFTWFKTAETSSVPESTEEAAVFSQ